MNKQTRYMVSLLFIVVIVLAVAITRSYLNVPNNPAKNGGGEDIETIIATNGNGISIFSNGSGDCGLMESGRMITAPEWLSIEFAENDLYIVSKEINGSVKFGCIDGEGNLIVPLIYSSIEKISSGSTVIYRAVSEKDGSCVIYDESFVPCFNTPWKDCVMSDEEITLTDDRGTYVYTVGTDKPMFKNAVVTGDILNKPYEINISSRLLLSGLNPTMIRKMTECTEAYMEYAYSGDKAFIEDFGDDLKQFDELYPNSDEIKSKRLLGINEMHIYSGGSDNGLPLYEVSVMADTEITYTDYFGLTGNLGGIIKFSVIFRGSSEYNVEILSGSFESETPEYSTESALKDKNKSTSEKSVLKKDIS